ncbi:PEP-CTERM sorting domain-containing protein [Gemmatimonas groenlandica]|uniref:PEP-CTERM sorting domain-containing protein n=1 Tax=Gemmatimonas groenlandica TaxID=2732249 RepID=UPI001E2CC9A7|nr:PEP-CTERM sorting domain-containing protein [Gemmatimonas groenlandica]
MLTIFSLGIASIAWPAHTLHAQPATVTFDALTESSPGSGIRFVQNCYVESGFQFTAVGVPCTGAPSIDAFVAGSANSPIFDGSTTPSFLLNTSLGSLIDITRVGGGQFSFLSIALAPYFEANTTVLFTGTRAGGNVTQSFDLLGMQSGFMTVMLNATFNNLTSLRLTANNQFSEPLVKFDNVALVGTQVVPEPSTVLLSAAGLAGIALLRLRRRTRA